MPQGYRGGGKLTTDVTLTIDAGNGLGIDNGNLVDAGDDTITMDAGGIKANLTDIFDPAKKILLPLSMVERVVVPLEGDYNLTDLGDVTIDPDAEDGYVQHFKVLSG